jgi:uncharacterized protein (DUF1778 family)
MTTPSKRRSERIGLRITPTAKRTIERAAAASNKRLTDFLVDSALDAACAMLADRRVLQVDEKQWRRFLAVLATPPKKNPRLRKLLARKPAWEQ